MTAPPRTRSGRYGSHVRASGDLELWVYDELDADYGVNAGDLVRDLRAAGPVPVTVRINSGGGDVFGALGLYEALRTHAAPVTVYVDGLAASAASVIAMAGTDVAMGPGSFLMLHDALTWSYGNEAEHLATAKLLGQVSDQLAAIYASRAGGTAAKWREVMRQEVWYSSSEAVAAGLADRVVEVPSPVSARAREHRAAARRHQQTPAAAVVREALRAGLPGSSLAGVVAVAAGGPARRPAGRRAVPSVLPLLKAMRAARR
jgi:ATP-dependent protease ClpP protease subunit